MRGTPNTFPSAEFRRLWADLSIPAAEVGRLAGYNGPSTARSARGRAAAMGLPDRPLEKCGRKLRIGDADKFRSLWVEGFSHRMIAREFRTTPQTVRATAKRLGLVISKAVQQ